MLIPKRVKRRRQHRGTMKGKATKGNVIAYGEYVTFRSFTFHGATVLSTSFYSLGN